MTENLLSQKVAIIDHNIFWRKKTYLIKLTFYKEARFYFVLIGFSCACMLFFLFSLLLSKLYLPGQNSLIQIET